MKTREKISFLGTSVEGVERGMEKTWHHNFLCFGMKLTGFEFLRYHEETGDVMWLLGALFSYLPFGSNGNRVGWAAVLIK